MDIRHSIVMICYNQEKYIRVALDSILLEKVKPYEVIIGDDASTDGTRAILQEYAVVYPGIVKLVLNEKNLGIFANLNNITHLPAGDMIHFLAGDDWFKPGFLENINKKVAELGVDPSDTSFMLLPHLTMHRPDGSEYVLKNDPAMIKKYSPVGLALRDMVYWRIVGLSRALFDKWPLFSEDSAEIGPWADRIQYVMLMQHVEQQHVMDCEAAVYRTGVGISSVTKQLDLERSYYNALLRLRQLHDQGGLALTLVDRQFIDFLIQCWHTGLNFSLLSFIRLKIVALKLIWMDWYAVNQVAKEIYLMFRRLASKNSLIRFVMRKSPAK